jgi:hypothetical protein
LKRSTENAVRHDGHLLPQDLLAARLHDINEDTQRTRRSK